eukprot:gene6942-11105_t
MDSNNKVYVHSLFKKYDNDGSNQISTKEISTLFNDLGFELETDSKNYLISSIDQDNTGIVSFDEFYAWWSDKNKYKLVELAESSPDLCGYAITLFQYYDQDKSKNISHSEFKQMFNDFKNSQYDILKKVVEKDGNKNVEDVIKKIDSDNSGNINIFEFVSWLHWEI